MLRSEQHHRDHRARVGGGGATRDAQLRAVAAGGGGQERRRPRVQSVGVGEGHRGADQRSLGIPGLYRDACAEFEVQHRVETRAHLAVARAQPADALGAGDHDHRHQADGAARDEVGVEAQQLLAGDHCVALTNLRREPDPLELDRVDADVDQHLDPGRGLDCDRVAGPVQLRDDAIDRRQHLARGRVDRDAIAHRTGGEHRVRHARKRDEDPGQRGNDG